jgi:hypothetical protein
MRQNNPDIGAQDALPSFRRPSARVAGSSRGMCMTRKEIEKQIAALKKEALACDYNTGDPHKWRVTIDNIWEDIERLNFILECAPNKAAN